MRKTPVMIKVFNNGYLIALLLFLAGSTASLCDGVMASKGLGVAELAAIGVVYPYTKAMECISLMFSSLLPLPCSRCRARNFFLPFSSDRVKAVPEDRGGFQR